MVKVWGRVNSINMQKVMWTLGELDLAYETVDTGGAYGGNDQDWFLEMNPNGTIPVIQDGDLQLWESNAIVRYLAAKYAPGRLAPAEPDRHGLADQWMDWQQTTFQPQQRAVFWQLIRTPEGERDMASAEAGRKECIRLLGILDRALAGRDYLLGEEFTMADIPLGCAAYRWYALPIKRPSFMNVEAWYERLKARPAFQEHVMIPLT